MPAGPAPTTSTSAVAVRAPARSAPDASRAGTPRPAVAFCVQPMWRRLSRLGDADVAADALADLVEAALLDLARQEGVGDGRPGGADQVPGAARYDLGHRSGVVRRPTPTIGFAVASRTRAGPLELPALAEEARRAGVLRPLGDRADVDVPEVDEVVGEAHELRGPRRARRRRRRAPSTAMRQAIAQSSPTASRDRLEHLEPEARAVLQRAAVLVRALVVERRQELAGRYVWPP